MTIVAPLKVFVEEEGYLMNCEPQFVKDRVQPHAAGLHAFADAVLTPSGAVQSVGVASIEDVKNVHIELVWDPPWTPERMSEAARLELNM